MLHYERQLWESNIQYIAGIDEVGRGCLFGDVVAAAVMLPPDFFNDEIVDSKSCSPVKREQLYDLISDRAWAIGIGKVDAVMIDRINIKQASRLAMKLAVEQLSIKPEHLLVDAERIDCNIPQMAIVRGDARSQSIAAASIIAKVTRDRMCLQWDELYPEYGFARHKGYATKLHRQMIHEYGASPMHRTTFLGNIWGKQ